MTANLENVESVEKRDLWKGPREFIEEHQALLLDYNISTKDMTFENGVITHDNIQYQLTNLGWRTLCGRMAPVGQRKPPAEYIKRLPHELQNKLMEYHFGLIRNTRHFMRAKSSDDGPFIRAFLSETYLMGRFDNADFMKIILEDFTQKMPNFRPVSYNVGENLFHMKTTSDAYIQDPVEAKLKIGVLFSDSEVGAGSVVIRPFVRSERGADLFILREGFSRRHSGPKTLTDPDTGKRRKIEPQDFANGLIVSDKLRIGQDVRKYIDQMLVDKDSTKSQTQTLILKYYETELPLMSWAPDHLEAFFKWIWERLGSTGLSKSLVKSAIEKLQDYGMKNLWGFFNALVQSAKEMEGTPEQRLDAEIQASKAVARLYSLLK